MRKPFKSNRMDKPRFPLSGPLFKLTNNPKKPRYQPFNRLVKSKTKSSLNPAADIFSRDMDFLWLLRGDVREKLIAEMESETEAKKDFVAWWLLFGRKEYPDNFRLEPELIAIARDVVAVRGDLPVTRIMRFLAHAREDVRAACTGADGFDWNRYIQWYFVHGVKEYDLFPLLSEAELEYLETPVSVIPQDVSMPITWLMHALWTWQPEVSGAFDLQERMERERYVAWFYIHGLKTYHYFGYIRLAQAIPLCGPTPYSKGDANPPVTRLMGYLWLTDNSAREQTELASREGRVKLRALLYERLHSQDELKPLWDILNSNRKPLFHDEATDPPKLGGVNLVGYALGELGIGEDVRMMARALESAGIPFCILNRQPGQQIRQLEFSMTRYLAPQPRYPITLVCMTAFDTAALWMDRPDIFQNTYTIGCWPWELPAWPGAWNKVYELVDEVWSSSHYTFLSFTPSSPVPVRHMPMAVTIDELAECPRSRFGLPEGRFLFLFVFDFMSYPARKNPEGCVEAFLKAFPKGDEAVNLVLKVSNVIHDSPLWKAIEEARNRDLRIIILDITLDKPEVLGLIQICDAYLSLHRAEGFGRTLAEAMLMEKPVIATDYSGNVDYLNEETGIPVPYRLIPIGESQYPYGEGQVWAEPDTDSAAAKMRSVFEDRDGYMNIGASGRRYILDHYSPATVGGRIKQRLAELLASSEAGIAEPAMGLID